LVKDTSPFASAVPVGVVAMPAGPPAIVTWAPLKAEPFLVTWIVWETTGRVRLTEVVPPLVTATADWLALCPLECVAVTV
jgi:hypothetical protein